MVLDPLFSAPFFSRYEQPRNISILGAYSYTIDMQTSGWCFSLLLIHANFLKPTNRYLMVVPTLFVSYLRIAVQDSLQHSLTVALLSFATTEKWHFPQNFEWPHIVLYKQVSGVGSVSVHLFGQSSSLDGAVPMKSQWREVIRVNEIQSAFSCSFSIFCYLSAGLQEH